MCPASGRDRRGAAAAVRRPHPGRTVPRRTSRRRGYVRASRDGAGSRWRGEAVCPPARLRLCSARRSRVVGAVRPAARLRLCSARRSRVVGAVRPAARLRLCSARRSRVVGAVRPGGAATSVLREAEQGRGSGPPRGAATSVLREAEHRRSAAGGITPGGAGRCRGQLVRCAGKGIGLVGPGDADDEPPPTVPATGSTPRVGKGSSTRPAHRRRCAVSSTRPAHGRRCAVSSTRPAHRRRCAGRASATTAPGRTPAVATTTRWSRCRPAR